MRNSALGLALVLAMACGSTMDAPTPEPPTVETGEATILRIDRAVVAGTIDSHGLDAEYWAEYGLDESYGLRTVNLPLEDPTGGPQIVVFWLTELESSTFYHYRFAASGAGGTTYGGDATFLTPTENLPPETFLTATGTDTTGTTVSMHLFWTGRDSDGEVAGYELRVIDHGLDGSLDPPDSLGIPWTATAVTDSAITWEDGLGSRTAFLRAIDDRGGKDPTPAFSFVEALVRPR